MSFSEDDFPLTKLAIILFLWSWISCRFPSYKSINQSIFSPYNGHLLSRGCLPTYYYCYVLTFDPTPKEMRFQGDAPEGSDTFQWPVIERDRVGGLRLIIWDKVKVPLCQYRLMHRKRVTSEVHDSYFRLMTIKHSIWKIQWVIVWALNYYLTQLCSSPRSSCQ